MNPPLNTMDRIPLARGRIRTNAPLAAQTWFRVGGAAEVLFKPADEADLATFLAACPADIPVTVIGASSNLIIRDGGISGVVVRLGREFAHVSSSQVAKPRGGDPVGTVTGSPGLRPEDDTIIVGAAALDTTVAQYATEQCLGGLEFLSGIPGAIGGALRMNAGAYGREMKDVLISARAVDRQGSIHTVSAADLNMTYRHSGAPADWIFTEATLAAPPADESAIVARMQEIKSAREASQPVRSRTGGSTFANPDGHKAWQLIDAAGCRGMTLGGAQMSELHCNFMLNTGNATAADLEDLGEAVRARVLAHSGIELRWEIQRMGVRAEASVQRAA